MMDGKTVQNMLSDIQLTQKIVHLVGFTIEISTPSFQTDDQHRSTLRNANQ